jgi:hypothetical protein
VIYSHLRENSSPTNSSFSFRLSSFREINQSFQSPEMQAEKASSELFVTPLLTPVIADRDFLGGVSRLIVALRLHRGPSA